MSDCATAVPTAIVEFAAVDADTLGNSSIVDMGSTGSSNLQRPSVESVLTGA